MPLSLVAALGIFLALCVGADLRSRRIPNGLSAAGVLLGTILHVVYFGSAGVLASVAGLVLGSAMMLPPVALGGVGAGDLKMMGAVGALVGPSLVFASGIAGMILGGLFTIVHVGRLGLLGATFRRLGTMVGGALARRSVAPLRVRADDPEAVTLPYSLPLALGTILVVGLGG